MRVLCLGMDGADYDLVRDLVAEGKLPTVGRLAREGTFGPLRSTIPAFTPTAWSSFLTGLNPAGHGIFSFRSNPNRSTGRLESAASRTGAPLWRMLGQAGVRSAYVTIPFTHPPEPLAGLVVTGFGGPQRPEIVPVSARNSILAAHPDLVCAPRPSGSRDDFEGFTRTLVEHVEEIADVCMLAMELEPELGLLCVDFMSSDVAGHFSWHRLDTTHPAHSQAGTELVRVYEAIDQACGELIEKAEWLWDEEPTAVVLSDHGMKPTHWVFGANRWLEQAGYLRYRRRTGAASAPPEVDEAAQLGVGDRDGDPWADETSAQIDFGATRAYCFGYGGQIYLGEAAGALGDRRFESELADALAAIPHPVTGEPAFEVKRKEELYRGVHLEKAPELVILARDERIHIDATRNRRPEAWERNDRLDRRGVANFTGHHGMTGIVAAAGPGIRLADVPEGAEITQMAGTLLALLGVSAELDGPPLEAMLDPAATALRAHVEPTSVERPDGDVFTKEEEARLVARLRDLGYE